MHLQPVQRRLQGIAKYSAEVHAPPDVSVRLLWHRLCLILAALIPHALQEDQLVHAVIPV